MGRSSAPRVAERRTILEYLNFQPLEQFLARLAGGGRTWSMPASRPADSALSALLPIPRWPTPAPIDRIAPLKTIEDSSIELNKYIIGLLSITVAAGGCAAIEKTNTAEEERTLAAAGFQMKLANTPERMMKVTAMPQRKFIKVPYHDGTVRYVWADAEFCKCLCTGTEAAYGPYWKLAMNQAIATDEARCGWIPDSPAAERRRLPPHPAFCGRSLPPARTAPSAACSAT
jgi:hypothetical protein